LLEYLDLFYRLGRAGKILERIGAIDFATTIAPGLRDVLLTGKVYEAARRRSPRGPVYDAVVLDAPPTGRIGRFLNVNEEVVGLAKMGPIRNQAGSIMTLLRSPQTVVHLVTVLEEMPVQETQTPSRSSGEPTCRWGRRGQHGARPGTASPGLAAARAGAWTATRWCPAWTPPGWAVAGGTGTAASARLAHLADGLVAEAREHSARVRLEAEQRERLHDLDRPTYELPALAEGIDLGTLYDLAEQLVAQGMA